jgi:hypothetical protein
LDGFAVSSLDGFAVSSFVFRFGMASQCRDAFAVSSFVFGSVRPIRWRPSSSSPPDPQLACIIARFSVDMNHDRAQ